MRGIIRKCIGVNTWFTAYVYLRVVGGAMFEVNLIRIFMKYFFLLLLFLFLTLSGSLLNGQAFQGFEDRMTDADCTLIDCFYTDPDQSAHELMDQTNSFGKFIPVNDINVINPGGIDRLGFKSFFSPTGSGAGLSEGDNFGFVKGEAITGSFGGQAAFAGNNIFMLEDVDGEVSLVFSPVRLAPGAAGDFTMQYIYSGSFDVGTPNDRLDITLEVTGCAAAGTVVLLSADGVAPPGAEHQWHGLSEPLTPFAGCDVQLIIRADVNTTSEEIGFDNINFAEGLVLPVEFIAFHASQQKTSVILDWATATETDNRGFSVERSLDGRTFVPVGWVAGAGDAQQEVKYTFEDSQVSAGQEYYYRLRQEDFDGAFAYSSIEKIKISGKNSDEVAGDFFPNPTVSGLSNLALSPAEPGEWTVTIVDIQGKVLQEADHTLTAGYNLIPIDLRKFPTGTYLVRISGEEQTAYRRVIRQ